MNLLIWTTDAGIKWSAVRRELAELHAQLTAARAEAAQCRRTANRCPSCLRSVFRVARFDRDRASSAKRKAGRPLPRLRAS